MIKKIIISFVFFYSINIYADRRTFYGECSCWEDDIFSDDYLGMVSVVYQAPPFVDRMRSDKIHIAVDRVAKRECSMSYRGKDFITGGDEIYTGRCEVRDESGNFLVDDWESYVLF